MKNRRVTFKHGEKEKKLLPQNYNLRHVCFAERTTPVRRTTRQIVPDAQYLGEHLVKGRRIIQINLNHCEVAHQFLTQMVREKNAEVMLISEPYKILNSSEWVSDKSKLVTIWASRRQAIQEACIKNEGFVKAKIGGEGGGCISTAATLSKVGR